MDIDRRRRSAAQKIFPVCAGMERKSHSNDVVICISSLIIGKSVQMSLLKIFWEDESGSTDAMFTVLFLTICAFGIIPGLASIRDQIVQHFGDTAVALESLDQSYSFTVGTVTSSYADPTTTLTDPAGDAPAEIDLEVPASVEN